MCIFTELSVIALLKVGAVIICCGEVDLELALDDDGHLNVIALARFGKGNGQKRKATLTVVPIGARAKRHIPLAVVHHAKRGIVRRLFVLNERTIVELEHLRLSSYMRVDVILVIQSARVGEAAVGDDV